MKKHSPAIHRSLAVLSVSICVHLWLPSSVVWAQDDALSAPTPSSGDQLIPQGSQIHPRPHSRNESEPADVVGQNGQPALGITSSISQKPESTPMETPAVTTMPTPSPTPTAIAEKPERKAQGPKSGPPPTPSLTPALHLPWVTTIPNPAYGDKVIFRVMTEGPAKARIVVYDRFFSRVKELHGEGDRLFDILWSLKKVSQGIYYYQAEITYSDTGESRILKMQSFAVMRDETNPEDAY